MVAGTWSQVDLKWDHLWAFLPRLNQFLGRNWAAKCWPKKIHEVRAECVSLMRMLVWPFSASSQFPFLHFWPRRTSSLSEAPAASWSPFSPQVPLRMGPHSVLENGSSFLVIVPCSRTGLSGKKAYFLPHLGLPHISQIPPYQSIL